jgi:tRNA(Ile)-lysidine synthase
MNEATEKVRSFIERHRMLEGARSAVIAVSGGPDSVALLDIMLQVASVDRPADRNAHGVKAEADGITLYVAHLDHMLRPDSAGDARFVVQMAERRGLRSFVRSTDITAKSIAERRGIEETAREARYSFLLRTAREVGADRIITGHTMNDQAETVMMRLIRGSGPAGLAGIRPVILAHDFGDFSDSNSRVHDGDAKHYSGAAPGCDNSSPVELEPVLLIRPLLCLMRHEVEQYCQDRELDFVFDSSNSSLDFTRNKIRHQIIPLMEAINPRVVESIARGAEITASETQAIDQLAREALERAALSAHRPHIGSDVPRRAMSRYSTEEFRAQPEAIRKRMIILALYAQSSSADQITSDHIRAIDSLIVQPASGKRVTLAGSVDVWREFDAISFVGRSGSPDYEFFLEHAHSKIEAGGMMIILERGLPGARLSEIIEEAQASKNLGESDWMTAVFDDEKLPPRLTVRSRRAGEKAQVKGHTRPKKLKNLMIDHRIPASRRSAWPLVASPEGCYVWSPGLPPSVDFVATTEARALAVLRARIAENTSPLE